MPVFMVTRVSIVLAARLMWQWTGAQSMRLAPSLDRGRRLPVSWLLGPATVFFDEAGTFSAEIGELFWLDLDQPTQSASRLIVMQGDNPVGPQTE